MPRVTASELAQLRGDLGDTLTDAGSQLVAIWRPPPMVGGRRGNAAEIATDVPMKIWPAMGAGAQAVLLALPDVANTRIDAVGFALISADLEVGDEIHSATHVYKVAGSGRWNATTALALSEVLPR